MTAVKFPFQSSLLSASLLSALLVVTAGCKPESSDTPPPAQPAASAEQSAPSDQLETEESQVSTYAEGVPGGITSTVETLTATAVEINREKRLVILQDEAGNRRQVQVPPAMVNFDQLQVGDKIKVATSLETIISVQEPGSATDEQSGVAAQAAKGEEPGLFVAESTQVTATVESIDEANRTATLKFADGSSRTVKVRDDIAMTPDYIGKQVVINVTTALAASIEKVEAAPAN